MASRFHTLIAEMAISNCTISFSGNDAVTWSQTASVTPSALIMVTSSVRAIAALSRSEYSPGASDQPASTSSLRCGIFASRASLLCMSKHQAQPLS